DVTLLEGSGLYQSIVDTCQKVSETYPQVDQQQLLNAAHSAWPKAWQETKIPWQTGLLSGKEQSFEAWRQTLLTYGLDDEEAISLASTTQLALYRETHQLYPDVEPIFAFLSGQNCRLGLMTNGASDTQREKLITVGLESRFDVIAISGEVGDRKPNPKIFDFVLEQIDIPPTKALMIGDNLGTDILGARQAGWKSAWINRSEAKPSLEIVPDFTIDSLTELIDILPTI
ncbi:MAG: HAD family hydrolase, partial [Chloroflexota bacterium]